MRGVRQLRPYSLALPSEPSLRIRQGPVRAVAALLAAKVHRRIALVIVVRSIANPTCALPSSKRRSSNLSTRTKSKRGEETGVTITSQSRSPNTQKTLLSTGPSEPSLYDGMSSSGARPVHSCTGARSESSPSGSNDRQSACSVIDIAFMISGPSRNDLVSQLAEQAIGQVNHVAELTRNEARVAWTPLPFSGLVLSTAGVLIDRMCDIPNPCIPKTATPPRDPTPSGRWHSSPA